MLSNLLFSYVSYEIKYHVSYIKQNSFSIATICKRPHVDKMNGAPAGPFYFRIEKKTLYKLLSPTYLAIQQIIGHIYT